MECSYIHTQRMERLLATGYWLGVLTVHIGSSSVRTQHTLELFLRVCRDKMVVV